MLLSQEQNYYAFKLNYFYRERSSSLREWKALKRLILKGLKGKRKEKLSSELLVRIYSMQQELLGWW